MNNIDGQQVSSPIVPHTIKDTYPTHYSIYGKGGHKEVATIEERDEIPEERLLLGTICYVKETDKEYIYKNKQWNLYTADVDLTSYATKDYVNSSTSGKADKSYVDSLDATKENKGTCLTVDNIIAGNNVTLNKSGKNVTINSSGSGSGETYRLSMRASSAKNTVVLTDNTSSETVADIPIASETSVGEIKLGYTENDKNYAVQLNNANLAFVTVPWTSGGSGGSTVSKFKEYAFYRYNPTTSVPIPVTPTGGDYDHPIPTYPEGWSDAVPEGTALLWFSTRMFYSDKSGSTTWSTPSLLADSSTLDVCFCSTTDTPTNPTVHNTLTGKDTSGYNWHDEGVETDNWMGLSTSTNGVWSAWSIVKIKGEKGEQGNPGDNGNWYDLFIENSTPVYYDINGDVGLTGGALTLSFTKNGVAYSDCTIKAYDPSGNELTVTGNTLAINSGSKFKYVSFIVSDSTETLLRKQYTFPTKSLNGDTSTSTGLQIVSDNDLGVIACNSDGSSISGATETATYNVWYNNNKVTNECTFSVTESSTVYTASFNSNVLTVTALLKGTSAAVSIPVNIVYDGNTYIKTFKVMRDTDGDTYKLVVTPLVITDDDFTHTEGFVILPKIYKTYDRASGLFVYLEVASTDTLKLDPTSVTLYPSSTKESKMFTLVENGVIIDKEIVDYISISTIKGESTVSIDCDDDYIQVKLNNTNNITSVTASPKFTAKYGSNIISIASIIKTEDANAIFTNSSYSYNTDTNVGTLTLTLNSTRTFVANTSYAVKFNVEYGSTSTVIDGYTVHGTLEFTLHVIPRASTDTIMEIIPKSNSLIIDGDTSICSGTAVWNILKIDSSTSLLTLTEAANYNIYYWYDNDFTTKTSLSPGSDSNATYTYTPSDTTIFSHKSISMGIWNKSVEATLNNFLDIDSIAIPKNGKSGESASQGILGCVLRNMGGYDNSTTYVNMYGYTQAVTEVRYIDYVLYPTTGDGKSYYLVNPNYTGSTGDYVSIKGIVPTNSYYVDGDTADNTKAWIKATSMDFAYIQNLVADYIDANTISVLDLVIKRSDATTPTTLNIVAGMTKGILSSLGAADNVIIWAGSSTTDDITSTLLNIKSAPFLVYEDGHTIANEFLTGLDSENGIKITSNSTLPATMNTKKAYFFYDSDIGAMNLAIYINSAWKKLNLTNILTDIGTQIHSIGYSSITKSDTKAKITPTIFYYKDDDITLYSNSECTTKASGKYYSLESSLKNSIITGTYPNTNMALVVSSDSSEKGSLHRLMIYSLVEIAEGIAVSNDKYLITDFENSNNILKLNSATFESRDFGTIIEPDLYSYTYKGSTLSGQHALISCESSTSLEDSLVTLPVSSPIFAMAEPSSNNIDFTLLYDTIELP